LGNMTYVVRRMKDNDIPQAIEVDREAFPTQWPHPTYASFKQELRNRLAHYIVVARQAETYQENLKRNRSHMTIWQRLTSPRPPVIDEETGENGPSGEQIVGLVGLWVMLDEAHITTIAVRDACRRQGIGERLLIALTEMSAQLNVSVVTLEVRASNSEAQRLYEKYGFQRVGMRRRYYSDNGEDAVIMTTDRITSPSFQSRFQELKRLHQLRRGELYTSEIEDLTPSRLA